MSRKTSLADELREPQRQFAELQALRRMLEASRGCFSLSLAVCNSPALRDHLIEELRAGYADIEVVAVPVGTVDVFGYVSGVAVDGRRAALFVTDLERSVPSEAMEQPALRSLNAARELWERTYPCPVVFWLPEYAGTLLAARAADFWRYRSHRFEFVSEQADARAGMADRFAGDFGVAAGLFADEKRFRIAELEQRLADLGPEPAPALIVHASIWLSELGFLYKFIGDLDQAEAMLRKSLAIEEKLGRLGGMASQYGNLGLVYLTRGDLDQAEAMLRKALEVFEQIENLEGQASVYGNLGLIYRTRGDLDQAEAMHRQALEIDERLGRLEGMATQYGNLGNVYLTRCDLDQAEAMHRKALEIDERLGRLEGMANAYGNLGNVYLTRGDLDQAEAMLRKALAIEEKLGRLEGMANAYDNLGVIYAKRGDLTAAREYWTQARDLFVRIGMPQMAAKVQGWLDGLPDAGSE